MKVLVFGPSGSGKTYVSNWLAQKGIHAFDADALKGLSHWYNQDGKLITAPTTAKEALNNGYAFLWSKKYLAKFLAQFNGDVFVFGGSGNVAHVFDIFDRVYFLHISSKLQQQRLNNNTRPNPLMDTINDEHVIWGDWFEQLATERQIPFIDASQTPQEIYKIISR